MKVLTYSDYIVDYGQYGGFDVKLVVQGQSIYTHRLILSAGSRFLKHILKSVDIDEEIATLVLPDHLLAEVKELVDILYNKKAPRPEGVVPQIFKSLGFNDIQPSFPIQDDIDPIKSSIKTLLDDAIKEEMLEDEEIQNYEPDITLEFDQIEEYSDLPDFVQEPKIKKKTRGPGKKWLLKSELSESESGATEVKKKRKKKYQDDEGITEFRCDQCDYVGKCRAYLNTHFAKRHRDRWFHCEYKDCEIKYRVRHQLTDHIRKEHQGRLFYCDKCSYKSKFNDLLKLHIMKHHEGVKFICDRCGYEAANPKSLGYHIKEVHEGKTYPCDKCQFNGKSYSQLWFHQTRVHSNEQFLCEQCTFVASDRGRLRSHVRGVHCEKTEKCDFCDFTTKKIWSLKRHKQSKHKEEVETHC